MSSVQHLREFIRERLTAAAQEIFTQVEKTIISYEEELDAQRRMMGIDWKQQIIGSELQRQSSDLQQPTVSNEEEACAIQQVWSLASRSNQDQKEAEHQWTEDVHMEPEPKLIKKEEEEPEPTLFKHEEIEYPLTYVRTDQLDSSVVQHEQQLEEHLPTGQDQKDLCSSQEGEQLVQKQVVALTSTLQEDDMNEEETRSEQLPLHVSPVVESKDQEGSSCSESESQSDTGTKKRSFTCDIRGRCCTQKRETLADQLTPLSSQPGPTQASGLQHRLEYMCGQRSAGRQRCRVCGKKTAVKCSTCDKPLCFIPTRDCYNKWHIENPT